MLTELRNGHVILQCHMKVMTERPEYAGYTARQRDLLDLEDEDVEVVQWTPTTINLSICEPYLWWEATPLDGREATKVLLRDRESGAEDDVVIDIAYRDFDQAWIDCLSSHE